MLYISLHTVVGFCNETSVRAAVDKFFATVAEAIDMVPATGSIRTWKLTFWVSRHLKILSEKYNRYELSIIFKSD